MTEVIEKTEYKKGYKKTKLGWIPEEWEECCLKDITTIFGRIGFRGYTKEDIVQKDEGAISLSPTNIKNERICYDDNTYISNFKYEESPEIKIYDDDIIFVKTGSSYGKSAIIKNIPQKATINPQLIVFKDIKINRNILFNILNTNSFNRFLQKIVVAGAIPTLSQEQIYKYPITLPTKKEQEKIAEILSAWDDGIETLEKLIEQKEIFHKALMKNLLIGKIRLFGFSKNSEYKKTKFGSIPVDWQIKPLKLLFDKRMQKYSGNTEYNIFTNSATKGVVLQNEYFDRSIVTEENASNYYIVGENDFMYNPRISQSAPAGPINRNKLGITGIASPLYTIFKAKHDTIVDFYEQYFSSNLWNNSMFMVANQGARHDRLNITNNDFMNMPLPYPPLKEQEKIANVLIESYKEIQILNSKLEKLKDQKKGLMQKLLTGQIRVKI